jgi:hypothetical protein
MKIETVFKINLQGEYECIYAGKDRGIARNIYKEMMPKKDEYMALFQSSGYSSRSMSKAGHISHSKREELKPVEAPKKRKRKAKPSEDSAE